MVTSSNENIFRVTGSFLEESTGHRWIPLTKASDAKILGFLWSALEQTVDQTIETRWFETPSRSLWRHFNEYFPRPYDTSICRGRYSDINRVHLKESLSQAAIFWAANKEKIDKMAFISVTILEGYRSFDLLFF